MGLIKRSGKKEKYGQGTQLVLNAGKRLNEERMKRLDPLTYIEVKNIFPFFV